MSRRMCRRTALRAVATTSLSLIAVACGPAADSQSGSPPAAQVDRPQPRPTFDPVLANSELVVGRNRFAVGLIGQDNRPITDARVLLGFYRIEGQQGTKVAEAEAQFRWIEVEPKGMWVAPITFTAPGPWGLEVTVTRPGGSPESARLSIDVQERGQAPTIGSPAPRAQSLAAEVDAGGPCSNIPPCELHVASLDQVLTNGRPTVVTFSTPGFCVTATCAPVLGVVLEARGRQPAGINFIHVEIYTDPRNQVVADAVSRWNLPSEPWTFLVDSSGMVAERYEGIVTLPELEAALAQLA